MSYDPSNPVPYERDETDLPTGADDQVPAGDRELGEEVGRALSERSVTVWTAPPVSLIEERAAARARARAARRTVAGIAAAALLFVGGVVAWNMLDGDGTGTVVVSAEDPDADSRDAEGRDTSAAEDIGATAPSAGAAGETGRPQSDAAADETGTATEPSRVDDDPPPDPAAPNPGDLSTGPVLQWTEIDIGFGDLYRLESVGDGRIVARAWSDPGTTDTYGAERIAVTTNGTGWTEVPLPAGVVPDQIDVSGDRWLVAGPEAGSDPFDGSVGRAFFSDDEGASWTEVDLGLPPDPAPVSPYVSVHSGVTSALVSGENMVLAVASGRSLDLHGLLEGRGLVPEGRAVVGWHGSQSGVIEFDLADAPASGDGSGSPGTLEYSYGSTVVESMPLSYDELGLTGEERAVFEDPGIGRVLVYAGDSAAVELVAEYEGWAWSGVATGEGFILKVVGPPEMIVTSPDGREWSEQPLLGSGSSAGMDAPDGTIWYVGFDLSRGLSIEHAGYGEDPTIAATFEGLQPTGGPAVGPAGLVVTAVPWSDSTTGLSSGFPEGRVSKDGYELRYNEPELGITLWDLGTDAAVYVFEPEDIMNEQFPQGVRETSGDEGFAVVFEDPETGADLVTFTEQDLDAIFAPAVDGTAAPRTLEDYEPPEMWVGWSADGTAWGWQLMADAFGIEDGEPWAEFAVGADFVLARVQTIEVPQILDSAGGQTAIAAIEGSEASGSAGGQAGIAWGTSGEPQPPRWFIGRMP